MAGRSHGSYGTAKGHRSLVTAIPTASALPRCCQPSDHHCVPIPSCFPAPELLPSPSPMPWEVFWGTGMPWGPGLALGHAERGSPARHQPSHFVYTSHSRPAGSGAGVRSQRGQASTSPASSPLWEGLVGTQSAVGRAPRGCCSQAVRGGCSRPSSLLGSALHPCRVPDGAAEGTPGMQELPRTWSWSRQGVASSGRGRAMVSSLSCYSFGCFSEFCLLISCRL